MSTKITFLQFVIAWFLGPPAKKPKSYRYGESWWCCPLHGEEHPSFHTLPKLRGKKEYWRCFGCDRWGDAHQFIIDIRAALQAEELPADYHGREALLFDLKKQYEAFLYGEPAPDPEHLAAEPLPPSGHAQSQRTGRVVRPRAPTAPTAQRRGECAGYPSRNAGASGAARPGGVGSGARPGEGLPSFFDFEQASLDEYMTIPRVDYRREDIDAAFRTLSDRDRAALLAAHAVMLEKGCGLPFEALAMECVLVRHYAARVAEQEREWLERIEAEHMAACRDRKCEWYCCRRPRGHSPGTIRKFLNAKRRRGG
jgi:CHC2 zinc finger